MELGSTTTRKSGTFFPMEHSRQEENVRRLVGGDAYDGQLHNANFSEFEKTLLQSGRKFHARRNPIGCMGVTLDGRRRVCAGDAGLPADEFEEKVFAV